MDYKELATNILKNVGGKENVNDVIHCVTRLRFHLKDESKANDTAIKNMDGVMDVIHAGGQYQVVIGPQVDDVYDALVKVGGFQKKEEVSLDQGQNDEKKYGEKDQKQEGLFSRFLGLISSIFQPVLGILMASGMFKALVSLFTVAGIMSKTSGTYVILYALGDALFYFFPVALGWSAAKRFGMKELYGITLGGILVYPTLVSAVTSKTLYTLFAGSAFSLPVRLTFLGIPVVTQTYSTTVIPIILIVWVASHIYKWLNKNLPAILRAFFVPFFTLLIAAPLGLIVIGPIAMVIQDSLSKLVIAMIGLNAGIAGLFLGTFWSILVMFGLHWAIIPLFAIDIAQRGYDVINPLIFAGALASMGSVLGVFLRTKDPKERSIAIPAFISSFFGINEPSLYGVLIPRKKVMISSFLSAGIGGAIAGFSGSKLYAFGASGPLGLPCFINPKGIDFGFIGLCLSGIVAFLLALISSMFFGAKKDVKDIK
ncbi:PTS transporter subunit EIIC [Oenococcus oeni]